MHERSDGDRLGQDDEEVRAGIRFAALAASAGVGFLIMAALWVSTCGGRAGVDTAACGLPERTLLALGAPAILFASGIWAFVRTYRVWRDGGTWVGVARRRLVFADADGGGSFPGRSVNCGSSTGALTKNLPNLP
ncbi:hypothetical protein NJB1728216S_09030 [Mycobacterium marinum]|nr:hypothetical protein NJB1907f34b_34630 [Mycobacterium marinum]GJO27912.1 hypothetical protein NJB1728e18_39130 [Mycobacterium marinum]GJO38678.1 hypothetical protein NJB1728e24_16400 [Mycobacterium marinum]GJO54806.1 hypothetical protein NJB1728f10_05000 [Mycobacterium marinum]GJO62796.1 hypothetical protein NJB1728216S_09030 [Mycobacterium marinum]